MFPEDEQYTCSHCVKTYASQGTLHVHMAQVHSAAKPFQCDLCPRSYKYKKSLRIHKIKHQGMAQAHHFFIFRLLYEFHLTMLFRLLCIKTLWVPQAYHICSQKILWIWNSTLTSLNVCRTATASVQTTTWTLPKSAGKFSP